MSKQVTAAGAALAAIVDANKKLTEEEIERLVGAAKEARQRAHCPYSKFAVGAALLTEDGNIVQGANVENASYGLTICGERSAICAAVVQGHRHFSAIAVVTDVGDDFGTPCGACRQVLAEFSMDMEVYLAQMSGKYIKTTMKKLLPAAFTPDKLNI
ncbi:cytidine deaminase [Hyalella azteca]|uniref:Cytidine deaminase n=1 Tax=Hyalella azteca TaxID=294128 RepID=A0A8B7PGH4_HYAAZ|nr:cytidine deaminase [Hyalella azteca]